MGFYNIFSMNFQTPTPKIEEQEIIKNKGSLVKVQLVVSPNLHSS